MGAKSPKEEITKIELNKKSKTIGFKNFVKNRILEEREATLCGQDLYQMEKGGTSSLMNNVMDNVDKVSAKSTVSSPFQWTQGYAGREVYRGGDAIFKKMGSLIENAQEEVLIQTFIFNFNGAGTKIIFDSIVKLEAKRKAMKLLDLLL